MDGEYEQELVAQALKIATRAVKEGGEALLPLYRRGTYRTSVKGDTSLQTEADLLAEEIIIARLQGAFPGHTIESEERGLLARPASPFSWKIDPLDGTENFVLGIPYFSSTATFLIHNEPWAAVVYDPVMEALYTAERGKGARLNGVALHVSRTHDLKGCRAFLIPDFATKHHEQTVALRQKLHARCRRVLDTWSPALDWCLVASGKADLVVAVAHEPIAPDAGMLILKEAGGEVTDFLNNPFTGENQTALVGSNGRELHAQFLQLAQSVFCEQESPAICD